MTFQDAINQLASGNRTDEAVKVVAQAVGKNSRRGANYSGSNSTDILDWVAEGDFTGDETLESLVADWDK